MLIPKAIIGAVGQATDNRRAIRFATDAVRINEGVCQTTDGRLLLEVEWKPTPKPFPDMEKSWPIDDNLMGEIEVDCKRLLRALRAIEKIAGGKKKTPISVSIFKPKNEDACGMMLIKAMSPSGSIKTRALLCGLRETENESD